MKFKAAMAVLVFTAAAICVLAQSQTARTGSQPGSGIDIPFQKFVLKNGLTLIVHEDHKAPIVAVNVWYHVGSKNEKPGKTGFAHLFEHLMFGGSEHAPGRYIDAMEKIGATDLNGPPTMTARTISKTSPRTLSTTRSGWNRTAWAICWALWTRKHSTCSAAWCKTKNVRVRISLTA